VSPDGILANDSAGKHAQPFDNAQERTGFGRSHGRGIRQDGLSRLRDGSDFAEPPCLRGARFARFCHFSWHAHKLIIRTNQTARASCEIGPSRRDAGTQELGERLPHTRSDTSGGCVAWGMGRGAVAGARRSLRARVGAWVLGQEWRGGRPFDLCRASRVARAVPHQPREPRPPRLTRRGP